jgi:hypothetical protein
VWDPDGDPAARGIMSLVAVRASGQRWRRLQPGARKLPGYWLVDGFPNGRSPLANEYGGGLLARERGSPLAPKTRLRFPLSRYAVALTLFDALSKNQQDVPTGRGKSYWFMLEPLIMSKQTFDALSKASRT